MSKAGDTRLSILQKAFELIYVNGYQATSVDEIIATTRVTKGAFFYHFKNKDEMGLAMIREVMYTNMHKVLVEPILQSTDPVKDLYAMMKALLLETPRLSVTYGCPANNLIQEMAPLSKPFNTALAGLVVAWQDAIQACVRRGKASGLVRKSVDPAQVASFIMSGYGGVRNLGKIFNTTDCYITYLKELKRYLKSLK